MSIYRVEVERVARMVLWVGGPDEESVQADAEELAASIPTHLWDDSEDDVVSIREQEPKKGTTVWSGGPDGHDYSYGETP